MPSWVSHVEGRASNPPSEGVSPCALEKVCLEWLPEVCGRATHDYIGQQFTQVMQANKCMSE